MKYLRLLNKLGNALFIPVLIGVVCILIFKDELDSFQYGQTIRYLLFIGIIIALVGILIRTKNEKNH